MQTWVLYPLAWALSLGMIQEWLFTPNLMDREMEDVGQFLP